MKHTWETFIQRKRQSMQLKADVRKQTREGTGPWTPMRAPDNKPLTPSSGNYNELALQHGGVRWGLWGWTIWVGWGEFQPVTLQYNYSHEVLGLLMPRLNDWRRCPARISRFVGCFGPEKTQLLEEGEWTKLRLAQSENFNLQITCGLSLLDCYCVARVVRFGISAVLHVLDIVWHVTKRF